MKKVIPVLLLVVVLFSGCGLNNRVEHMRRWSFQYNESTDDYSLFFGLCDSSGNYISASGRVKIRIVDSYGQILYQGEKKFSKKNFGEYNFPGEDSYYLADIRIERNEVEEGYSSDGKVYFTVESDTFSFDESNAKAYDCLPMKQLSLSPKQIPVDVRYKDYFGSQTYRITNLAYDNKNGMLEFIISGEVISGSSRSYSLSQFSYKIYDESGYMIESGDVNLDSNLKRGDKFRVTESVYKDLTPGQNYTIEFCDYSLGY